MKKKSVVLGIYSIAAALMLYLLPLLVMDTGSGMFILLILIPLLLFFASLAYGVICGFSLLPTAVTAALFIPTVFIYFNSSAWVYAPIYAVIAFAGVGIGTLLSLKKNKNK